MPSLTTEMVNDDEQLAEATDAVMLADLRLRRMAVGIVRAQRGLLALLGDDRGAYLVVEERVNERLERVCSVIARWAFEGGRRSTRRRARS